MSQKIKSPNVNIMSIQKKRIVEIINNPKFIADFVYKEASPETTAEIELIISDNDFFREYIYDLIFMKEMYNLNKVDFIDFLANKYKRSHDRLKAVGILF